MGWHSRRRGRYGRAYVVVYGRAMNVVHAIVGWRHYLYQIRERSLAESVVTAAS